MDVFTLLFDTRILFFRTITLLVMLSIFLIRYYKTRQLTTSLFETIFLFLCSEWAWQLCILFKWGLLSPNLNWLQIQASLPFYNLFYVIAFVTILPHILKSTSRMTMLILFLPQFGYQLLANLASSNVIQNDYGYAVFILQLGLSQIEKAGLLVWDYLVPKLIIFSSAFLWRKQVG